MQIWSIEDPHGMLKHTELDHTRVDLINSDMKFGEEREWELSTNCSPLLGCRREERRSDATRSGGGGEGDMPPRALRRILIRTVTYAETYRDVSGLGQTSYGPQIARLLWAGLVSHEVGPAFNLDSSRNYYGYRRRGGAQSSLPQIHK